MHPAQLKPAYEFQRSMTGACGSVALRFEVPADEFDERWNRLRQDSELDGECTTEVGRLLLNPLRYDRGGGQVEFF